MPTVLVVDNDSIVREPIAATLVTHGFEVLHVGCAFEALKLVNECTVDLVILELELTKIHGITILSRIRDDPWLRELPVILLTKCVDQEVLAQARGLGVKHLMLKSQFTLDTFLTRVTSALGGSPAALHDVQMRETIVAYSKTGAHAVATSARRHQPEMERAETSAPVSRTSRSWEDSLRRLRKMKPLLSRAESMRRLESCPDLSALSPAVTKLLKLTGGDSGTVQQVSKALRQDHSLALRILKLANSSMYSRGEPVETLDKAVLRIGMGQIRHVLLSIAIVDSFDSDEFDGCLDLGLFWEHSIGSGIMAAGLAETRSGDEAERAFTMGLIHNVGRLMLARAMPELFAQVISVADNVALPLHVVEGHLLGVNHAECMDHLLRRWRFPKEFIGSIVRHHPPATEARKRVSNGTSEFAILALAERLCTALLIGDDGEGALSATEELCDGLELPEDQIEKIAETAIDETADVKLALLAQIKDSKWTDSKSIVHERLQTPIRTAYCSVRPQFDAFSFFFRRLDDEECRENLAVARMTAPGDIGSLTYQLSEHEKRVGERLPLLVVCSGDSIECRSEILEGRSHAVVQEPVGIRELTAMIHDLVADVAQVANAA